MNMNNNRLLIQLASRVRGFHLLLSIRTFIFAESEWGRRRRCEPHRSQVEQLSFSLRNLALILPDCFR